MITRSLVSNNRQVENLSEPGENWLKLILVYVLGDLTYEELDSIFVLRQARSDMEAEGLDQVAYTLLS